MEKNWGDTPSATLNNANPTQEDRMVNIREKMTQKDSINQVSQGRTQNSEGLCW